MAETRSAEVDEVCPHGHPVKGIGILCPERRCRGFILFATTVYREHKKSTFAHASLLVLSTMAALILSRFSGHVWPLYVYLTLGVVLLYATVFSRGTTLGPTTWILTAVSAAWLIWYVASRLFGLSLGDSQTAELTLRLLPPIGWLAFTAYMYYLGSHFSLTAIAKPATYFLTAGAFTFGFWGVWLILLEVNMVNTLLYQIAIGLGLLLPLMCVGLLIWQAKDTQRSTNPAGDGSWNLLALWLVVIATYLVLIEPMIQALAFLLGRFLPLAAGHEPLADITVDWLGGPGWRAVLTSVLLMIAATLVAVRSFIEVTDDEGNTPLRPADTGSLSGQEPTPKPDEDLVLVVLRDVGETAKRRFFDTGYAGTYYGKIGLRFAENVLNTARYVVNVAIPVVMFSAISLLVVLVLSAFQDYRDHGPFFASIALWGTGLTTWIVVVVMCGFAFESAPYQQRGAGRPFIEMGAASLLGGLLYFIVSLVSVALLPLWLYPRDTSATFDSFTPGDIYLWNLGLSMSSLLILVVLAIAFRKQLDKKKGGKEETEQVKKPLSRKERIISYSIAAVVLLALGAGASYFAIPPIVVAATYVSSPNDTAAADSLRDQVPTSLASTCKRDQLLLTSHTAGLACHATKSGTEISYHLFATEEEMNQWYTRATVSRGITTGQGSCGTSADAEGEYTRGSAHGRVACYTDRAGSWLIWTNAGSKMLGIARSPDRSSSDLYSLWSTL